MLCLSASSTNPAQHMASRLLLCSRPAPSYDHCPTPLHDSCTSAIESRRPLHCGGRSGPSRMGINHFC